MNLHRRTSSNIAWILLSDILSKGATIFATVYLARVLGVSEFGMFSLGVAIVNSIWPVVDLGTTGYGTREVARDRSAAVKLLSSLNTMRLFVSLLMIIVAVIVLEILNVPDTKKWVIIGALTYLTTFAVNPDWVVRGMEQMPVLLIINLVAAVAFIAGIALAVSGPDDVIRASFIRSFSFGAGSLVGLAVLYWNKQILFRIKVDVAEWYRLIRKTSYFLFNRISTNLGQYLTLFFVTYFLSESSLGLFAAPHRLYIIGISGLAAISSAIYPILSSLYNQGSEQFISYQRQLVHLLLILFIPFLGLGLVGAVSITDVVYGADYSGSSNALMIMLFTLPFAAMRSIYMFTLLCGGMERITSFTMFMAVIIQAIVAAFCVPAYGIEGAAAAILAGEAVAFGMLWFQSSRRMHVKGLFNRQTAGLLLIVTALVVLALALNWGIIGIVFGGVPLYVALLVIFKQIPVETLRKNLISRSS